jgi:ribonuclease R
MKTRKENTKNRDQESRRDSREKRSKPTADLKTTIIQFLQFNKGKAFSAKEVGKKLGLRSRHAEEAIPAMLDHLVETGVAQQLRNGTYKFHAKTTSKNGVVDHVSSRFAYVVMAEGEDDIWVSSEALNGALDGDTVQVAIYNHTTGRKPEGEVVEVLQRKKDEFVGVLEVRAKYGFVVPDNRKMYTDIYVKKEDFKEAQAGDKVIVKVTKWPMQDEKPEGFVTRVLGKAGEHEAEMHSIMAEFGLPFEFPEEVEAEANAISTDITAAEISRRRDFRDVLTFTIDPIDAKDFDDAISMQQLENGNWEIGVHIADVTHYVKPDTDLEREAFRRATSVYLVDRTIPMLPEKLSNGLCSLRPHEDKLTFSAVFELDHNAKIKSQWFGRTVIHSDRRFAYEEVQDILETGEGDFAEELKLLNQLAYKLRDERFRKGAVNFETVEVKFRLDEKGVPLAVMPKIRKDAHKLIEDFMLLANKQVAEYVYKIKKGKEKLTMVYRIHDAPDETKMQTFANFVKRFGYSLNPEEGKVAASLNKFIENLEGKPEQYTLQNLAIRTMAKARYSTDAVGHFGLAYAHYTHFTSPIRRYPDMMAHRLLQRYLDEEETARKEVYEDKCKHSSEREKVAADAERASIKYKQVEFMRNATDKDYEAIVTGVTEFGVFAEIIETRCEGMIRLGDLDDDYYDLDEKNYRILGRRTGKIIAFGDKVVVRVKETNLDKRTIDFELVALADGKPLKNTTNDRRSKKQQAEPDWDF